MTEPNLDLPNQPDDQSKLVDPVKNSSLPGGTESDSPVRKPISARKPLGFSATNTSALLHTGGGVTATPNTGSIPTIKPNLIVTDPKLRKITSSTIPNSSNYQVGSTPSKLSKQQELEVQNTAANLKAEFAEEFSSADQESFASLTVSESEQAENPDLLLEPSKDLGLVDQPKNSNKKLKVPGFQARTSKFLRKSKLIVNHQQKYPEAGFDSSANPNVFPDDGQVALGFPSDYNANDLSLNQKILAEHTENNPATSQIRPKDGSQNSKIKLSSWWVRSKAERSNKTNTTEKTRYKQLFRSGWFPTEHGAYAMVIMPFWIGAGLAGVCWSHALLFLAWMVSYFAFFAATLWLRSGFKDRYFRPVQVYGVFTGILGATNIILHTPLLEWGVLFLPVLAIAATQAYQRKERSILSRTASVIAASLMALVAYDLGTDFNRDFISSTWLSHGSGITLSGLVVSPLGTLSGWYWALLVTGCIAAYYWSTIFFVKSLVRKRNSVIFQRKSQLVHLILFLLMLSFQLLGWLRIWHTILWAFMLVTTFLAPRLQKNNPKIITVKRIGQYEVVLSILIYLAILL